MSTSVAPSSQPVKLKPIAKWAPTIKVQRFLALLLLIFQGGITVTGSIVRVTGSGLGCDTWPLCHEGSLVPVAGAAPWIHQAVEFGNRMLTFVLVAAALAVFLAVLGAKRRKEIVVHSFIQGLGIILQAVIGGITVLVDLHWYAVALHFLPSMILVFMAAILYTRIGEPDDGEVVTTFPSWIRTVAVIGAVALSIVLITGTMTTGAGVHSGDSGVGMDGRLEVDIDWIAHVHGYSMYVYLFFTLIVVAGLYRSQASTHSKKLGLMLILFILVQAGIGILQYRMGVPRWTIPFHIAMSSVVVAFTSLLWSQGRVRKGGSATVTGSPEGDQKHRELSARKAA
ncbi:cytochrome oxidase assembly protein [Corynebacterium deserti GIMN1.010]|uniref:Cytochrome oxidase assembly protein n=1 Tax=Corynebacterium deserti GIMN1.010 TaxID=931089 RepID=A0A0M4CJL0_9CORY|nr:heme A synthase [Corynebacterium deserti]ALC05976.1 cytochrome oxidase assembly protein [Corynebacterium deserti GIMN1.010]